MFFQLYQRGRLQHAATQTMKKTLLLAVCCCLLIQANGEPILGLLRGVTRGVGKVIQGVGDGVTDIIQGVGDEVVGNDYYYDEQQQTVSQSQQPAQGGTTVIQIQASQANN